VTIRTPRQFALVAGLIVWLGATIVQTGTGGIVALWTALLLVMGLALVTGATRTVAIRDLLVPFCLGGAMLAPAVLAGAIFDAQAGGGFTAARAFGIPIVEETFKLAPVWWLLWRGRRGRTWTLGVSDVLVLVMASGAGFGFVEDAFVRHARGWGETLAWLPTSEVTSDRHGSYLTNGHGPMTAIAGIALGFALLLRRPRAQMIGLAAAGFGWSILDHARNNYNNHFHDALSATMNFVTGNSFLTAYLFLLGTSAAIAVDAYSAYVAPSPVSSTPFPSMPRSWDDLKAFWRAVRERNQLAYSIARRTRESGAAMMRPSTHASVAP
jgi:hypothetical protein